MYLHALATALPDARYSQADCWSIVEQSPVRQRLSKWSMILLKKILLGPTGVEQRHFALPGIGGVFDLDADALNGAFRTHAPALGQTALERALDQAGLRAGDLDALLVCTCTGYLCPGVSSYVAESAGLRPDAFLQDLVGLGCGAAIPTLRAASHFLAANPQATVACLAVEVCSAAFFLDDDPGVIISACLFADGAAATIWRAQPPVANGRSPLCAKNFDTLHRPADRDYLRFEMSQGKLRNLLHKSVPERAASAVAELFARRAGERRVDHVVIHPGGRDVIEAVQARALPDHSLSASQEILRRCGNMSSPSVLFVLEETLRRQPDADHLWLSSFGAGFSAHSCALRRE